MKHTPGPWTYHTHQGHTLVQTEEPAKTVCNVYGNTTDAKEANARLIAAAPELLATLQEVVDYHKYIQDKCIWHLEANAQVDLIDLLRDTQAAIANATKEG